MRGPEQSRCWAASASVVNQMVSCEFLYENVVKLILANEYIDANCRFGIATYAKRGDCKGGTAWLLFEIAGGGGGGRSALGNLTSSISFLTAVSQEVAVTSHAAPFILRSTAMPPVSITSLRRIYAGPGAV